MQPGHPLLPDINQRIVEYNDDGQLLMADPAAECPADNRDADFHNLQQSLENMWAVFVGVYSMAGLAILVAAVQRMQSTKYWKWFANVRGRASASTVPMSMSMSMKRKAEITIDNDDGGGDVKNHKRITNTRVAPTNKEREMKY